MGIIASEIKVRPSLDMTQASTSGGMMDKSTELVSGLLGNPVTSMLDAERTAGVTRHYKIHFNVEDSENGIYKTAKMFISQNLTADIVGSLKLGTYTSTKADVAADRQFGTGRLATALTAGDQTIVVDTRGVSYDHFQNGDMIAVHNMGDYDDATGTMDFLTIDQAPSWNGDQVTLHVSSGVTNDYALSRVSGSDTIYSAVGSVVEFGDVETSFVSQNLTSASGTVDDNAGVIVKNEGAIYQTLTFTFDSATTYTVASNRSGVTMPSGNVSSLYDTTYLSVPSGFWGGTWTSGDSVQIVTSPATMPTHVYLDVPAGAAASNIETLYPWVFGDSDAA